MTQRERITLIVNLNLKLQCLSDAYILVKETISIETQARDNPNNGDKEMIFKNCATFTDCISEINNAQIDNAKNIDVVLPMYNLI